MQDDWGMFLDDYKERYTVFISYHSDQTAHISIFDRQLAGTKRCCMIGRINSFNAKSAKSLISCLTRHSADRYTSDSVYDRTMAELVSGFTTPTPS